MADKDSSRRALLKGAVVMAGASAVSAVAATKPQPSSLTTISKLKMGQFKSQFVQSGTSIWNNFPNILEPLEATASQAIGGANDKDNPYLMSSRLVEIHLGIARTKLDQCFALRQSAHEIEIDACKAVWNRQLVLVKTDSDKGFEENYYSHLQFARGEQYDEPERKQAGQNTPTTYLTQVREALGARRDVAVQYEDALKDRRQLQYSGFNYVQRHEALRARFTDALVDAYLRCRACSAQLKTCFGIDKPLPTTAELGKTFYLDGISNWLSEVLLELERALTRDVQSEVSLWIKADGAGMTWTGNVLSANSGSFTVPQIAGLTMPRLMGLSVSVLSTTEQPVPSEFAIVVSPPGLGMKIPGVARVLNSKYSQEPAQIRCNALANIDPTAGAWSLDVAAAGRPSTLKSATISDILVSVRVAGRSG
jgi:hypothetical protein